MTVHTRARPFSRTAILGAIGALIVTGACGRASSGVVATQVGSPSWTFGGARDEMAYDMLLSRKGEFLITGFSQSWTSDQLDAFVLAIDGAGRERWRRSYGDLRSNIGFAIRSLAAGYVLAGWSVDSVEQPMLVRLGAAGELEGRYDVQLSRTARVTDVRPLPNGDFLLAGQISHPTDSLDAIVLRVDSTGQVVWRSVLGGPGVDRGFSLDRGPNGEIALVGLTTSPPSRGFDILVAMLDSTGRLLWRQSLGGEGYQTGHSVAWTPDGAALVTGYGVVDPARGNDSIIHWIATDGTITRTTSWGGTSDDRLMDVAMLPRGGYLAVGYATGTDLIGLDALVTRLDTAGAVLWEATFGGPGDQTAYSSATDGDHVVIAGHTEVSAQSQRDILVFSTDLNGRGLARRFRK